MTSDEKVLLKGYDGWVQANKPNAFTLFDYLHALVRDEDIKPDLVLALFSIIWPNFYSFQDKVFLREGFSQKRLDKIENNHGDMPVEYWMNLIPLSELFSFLDFDAQKFIGKKIVEIWKTKLKSDFPEMEFNVVCYQDEPEGLWCSFYQVK